MHKIAGKSRICTRMIDNTPNILGAFFNQFIINAIIIIKSLHSKREEIKWEEIK